MVSYTATVVSYALTVNHRHVNH